MTFIAAGSWSFASPKAWMFQVATRIDLAQSRRHIAAERVVAAAEVQAGDFQSLDGAALDEICANQRGDNRQEQ